MAGVHVEVDFGGEPFVDMLAEEGGDGINHKVRKVIVRDPFLNGNRKEHGGFAVNVLESGSHAGRWQTRRHRARKSLL